MGKIKHGYNATIDFIKKYFFKYDILLFAVILFIMSFFIRMFYIDFEGSDYRNFLIHWYNEINERGAVESFKYNIGDYTPMYKYLIILMTKLPMRPLYAFKSVSIFFDYVLAIFVGLVGLKASKSKITALAGYGLTLFLPNIFFNSAIWAQCDVIFTAFIVISIFCILCNKGHLAMISYAIALSFKIQAIFFAPVVVILILKGKIKFRTLFTFAITYVLVMIPAVICGMPFKDALFGAYTQQVNEYSSLSLNAPNLYNIFPSNVMNSKELGMVFTMMGIGITAVIAMAIYKYKFELTDHSIVLISLIFALVVPYLLPHMHERYFYLADVLGILFIILFPKKFYIAVFTILASFAVVERFLFGWVSDSLVTPMGVGLLMGTGIVLLGVFAVNYLKSLKIEETVLD